jgi:hypothetical protein
MCALQIKQAMEADEEAVDVAHDYAADERQAALIASIGRVLPTMGQHKQGIFRRVILAITARIREIMSNGDRVIVYAGTVGRHGIVSVSTTIPDLWSVSTTTVRDITPAAVQSSFTAIYRDDEATMTYEVNVEGHLASLSIGNGNVRTMEHTVTKSSISRTLKGIYPVEKLGMVDVKNLEAALALFLRPVFYEGATIEIQSPSHARKQLHIGTGAWVD